MAAMLTNTAHAEASDVDFVQLELGFALFSPEGQVEAGRPGELIAPGLQFAHAMIREPRGHPHNDIPARQHNGARLSVYAPEIELKLLGHVAAVEISCVA